MPDEFNLSIKRDDLTGSTLTGNKVCVCVCVCVRACVRACVCVCVKSYMCMYILCMYMTIPVSPSVPFLKKIARTVYIHVCTLYYRQFTSESIGNLFTICIYIQYVLGVHVHMHVCMYIQCIYMYLVAW